MKEGKDARSAISFPSRTQQLQTSIQLKYTAAANEIHYIFQNLSHHLSVILQEYVALKMFAHLDLNATIMFIIQLLYISVSLSNS